MDKLNVQTTAAVETASILVKQVLGAKCVKEVAEIVANVTKCVAVTSTVFH